MIIDHLVTSTFFLIAFLATFWAWIYGRRWAKTFEIIDLTNCILMSSISLVLSLSLSRYIQPDFYVAQNIRHLTRLAFIVVGISWSIHTMAYIRSVRGR